MPIESFLDHAHESCLAGYRSPLNLAGLDPDGKPPKNLSKEDEEGYLEKLQEILRQLQNVLYAEGKRKVLIVLQAMDTAGKDGVIRNVFKEVDPQGLKVAGFKAPTPEELSHDFLWRIHPKVPANGEMVVFNRSHYEDVLVTRVHRLIKPEVWKRRYEEIRRFEEMLTDNGTTILKFYLHISKEEQKKRILARMKDPMKRWKYNPNDLKERKLWPAYMKAYAEAIQNTSTPKAPWFVIPSNRKWYRNLLVLAIIIRALKRLDMKYPRTISN